MLEVDIGSGATCDDCTQGLTAACSRYARTYMSFIKISQLEMRRVVCARLAYYVPEIASLALKAGRLRTPKAEKKHTTLTVERILFCECDGSLVQRLFMVQRRF